MDDVRAVSGLVSAHRRAQAVVVGQDSHLADAALIELELARAACGEGVLDLFDQINVDLARSRLLRLAGRDPLLAGRAALQAARTLPSGGDEGRLLVQAMLDVADLEREHGHYGEARLLVVDAVDCAREALGVSDPDTAVAYNALGMVARYQGEVEVARSAYAEALRIAEGLPDRAACATILHNAASLEQLAGRADDALMLIQRALELRGPSEPGRDLDEGVLAVILTDLGDYSRARAVYRKLSEAVAARWGSDCTEMVYLKANQAVLEHRAGDAAAARSCYIEALAGSERLLGADHPQTGTICANIARLALATGDRQTASEHALRAATILRPLVAADLPALQAAEQVLHDLRQ